MRSFLVVLLALLTVEGLHAQQPADTTQAIEILPRTKKQMYRKLADGTELQILTGTVGLRQGSSLFYCDSLIMNSATKVFEAFGHVHINDSDTTQIYSNYLRYLTDTRYAYLTGNVKLTDGHGTLTTNELEYDVANKIGTYKNGGKVINRKSVLTSREGVYYSDTRDIFFKSDVKLKDPAYDLRTDSMIYNTETQVTRFITETFIKDSSGRTIKTSEGSYDLRNGNAEFTQRTTIVDGQRTIVGDEIMNDDKTGISRIRGNGILVDKKNGVTILANEIFSDKLKEAYLATRKPVMIIQQDKDSIYIAADTLFTARLSDRFRVVDSAGREKKPVSKVKPKADSTDRYFEAFRHVKVFSDSLQSVSDSLFYSFKDSTFRLYKDPIVWSGKNQITGDTVYLQTRNKKAYRMKVFENGFLVNQLQTEVFNQVKATRMDGFFHEGIIDSVKARGFAESIYFLQDKDSAYTGINQTSSDAMDVYFEKSDLRKVVFRSAVKGTLWPVRQKQPAEMRLERFRWLDLRRPKTKYDLFE